MGYCSRLECTISPQVFDLDLDNQFLIDFCIKNFHYRVYLIRFFFCRRDKKNHLAKFPLIVKTVISASYSGATVVRATFFFQNSFLRKEHVPSSVSTDLTRKK